MLSQFPVALRVQQVANVGQSLPFQLGLRSLLWGEGQVYVLLTQIRKCLTPKGLMFHIQQNSKIEMLHCLSMVPKYE